MKLRAGRGLDVLTAARSGNSHPTEEQSVGRRNPPQSRRIWLAVIAAAALLTPIGAVQAQGQPEVPAIAVSDTIYEIRTSDGDLLYARVAAVEGDQVTLETISGVRLDVSHAKIKRFQPASGELVRGEFWPEDVHATRLFFAPTGRSLRMGETNFGIHEVIAPFFSVGFTDRIMLSVGGAPLIGEFSFGYIAPKVEIISRPKFSFAIGGLGLFGTTRFEQRLVYGVGTFGDRNSALTAGATWFLTGHDPDDRPSFMLGGEHRVSRRLKLLTENYVALRGSSALLSGGIRILGDQFSADFGMGAQASVGPRRSKCCIPMVNVSYLIGSGK